MFIRNTDFVPIQRQQSSSKPVYSPYHVSILVNELNQLRRPDSCSTFSTVDSTIHRVSMSIEDSMDDCTGATELSLEHFHSDNSATVIQSKPDVSNEDTVSNYSLFAQAAQAASSIIYRYAVQKHPFNDAANQQLVEVIIRSMISVPHEIWQRLRHFRLFLYVVPRVSSLS